MSTSFEISDAEKEETSSNSSESSSFLDSSRSSSTSDVAEKPAERKGLLPGIIVMNRKYFLDLRNEAPKNGDMPFVMAIIQVLRNADAFLGMILYQKSEQLFPTLTYTIINNANCAVIPFNSKMYPGLLEDAITKACKHLAMLADSSTDPVAIIYHQDERLLETQPETIPFGITHHGPIHADVIKHFPEPDDILDAFGTDSKSWLKVNELKMLQGAGLEKIRSRFNGFVLEMSELQGEHFRRSGIRPADILAFPPPLHAMLSAHKPTPSTKPLFGVSRKYFLFTAVARLTFFKNADLLIDGAKILLERGMDLSFLVAGGDGSKPHSDIRARLVERVPSHLRDHVQVVERIPQEELYTYFNSDRVRETGIFVCSSRYETLGITPLEAALSGVTTVITDSKQVEATRYFPADYRFEASADELANRLEGLFQRNLLTCGQDLKSYIEKTIEERGSFENEFLKVWRDMSSPPSSSYHQSE